MTALPATSGRFGIAPFLGITLVALGGMTAITSYSPIAGEIAADIKLDDATYGLLGTLAPFTFALVSLVTPSVARKVTLEWTIVIAATLMASGQILRAFSAEPAGFFTASIVAMLGIASANLLLPPLVRRFFPDRQVSVGTVYIVAFVSSSIYPPLFAVPLAQWAGWRVSIGVWGLIEAVALVPWIITLVAGRRRVHAFHDAQVAAETAEPHAPKGMAKRVWSHSTSWAMVVMYAVGVFNFYIVVAWLPGLLSDTAGVTPLASGALLSLYGAVGLTSAVLAPILVAKVHNLGILFVANSALMAVGYLGLWFLPGTATWVWVAIAGLAASYFNFPLLAANYRTSSVAGSVTLTGMVAFGGYLLGSAGPYIVGLMRASGLGWTPVIIMLMVSLAITVLASLPLRRRALVDA